MIAFHNVSKSFRIYRHPAHWLRERILRRSCHETRQALHDVSFQVGKGEVFGIIGQNGAGKSTLLKLVMGVLLPDSGTVRHDGRVTGLLELGSGFNHQASGNDNIAYNGTLLGMTQAEIEGKRAEIIAFSELGDAIFNPLRTYSSGMAMRLAFSVAIHADPACLVVDEALAVGDAHFQQKCFKRLRDFKAGGGSILFVSHDLSAVTVLCDRAMVLEKGEAVLQGDPQAAIHHYKRIVSRMDGEENALTPPETDGISPVTSYGRGDVEIVDGQLRGEQSGTNAVESGEAVRLTVTARARCALSDVSLGILIRDRFGQDVFGINSAALGQTISFEDGEQRGFTFSMPMSIAPGQYTVTAALVSGSGGYADCYHWCDSLIRFEVTGFAGPRFAGICDLRAAFAAEAREDA